MENSSGTNGNFIFENGMFYCMGGKEYHSIISHERAREMELEDKEYAASMDVNKGGWAPEKAYPARGFYKNGMGKWVLKDYAVDELAGRFYRMKLPKCWTMPIESSRATLYLVTKRAFCNCNELEEVIIPEGIERIGEEAFAGCRRLERFHIPSTIWCVGKDVLKDTAFYANRNNWTDQGLYCDGWALAVKREVRGDFTVQEGTVGIADSAFVGCKYLRSVSMPESIEFIGTEVFADCGGLEQIYFPKEVNRYGSQVLKGCTALLHIDLPHGVKVLEGFENNQTLESISIPDSVTAIEWFTFRNCVNLTNIQLSNHLRSIGREAFENTGFYNDKKNWEENVLYLGNWLIHAEDAFRGEYMVKEGTIGIADGGFYNDDYHGVEYETLTEVHLPESIKYIGKNAFQNCVELQAIHIPNGDIEIKESAFRHSPNVVVYGPADSNTEYEARKNKCRFPG